MKSDIKKNQTIALMSLYLDLFLRAGKMQILGVKEVTSLYQVAPTDINRALVGTTVFQ